METEGLYFYFLGWIGWIIITFLFSKSAIRTFLSILLLSLLAGSTTHVSIYGFSVNVAFIILVLTAIILLSKTLKQRYVLHYFSICTLSLAYVCFVIFEIYDPVWIFIDRTWMLSFILLYITLLLFKTKWERFVFMLTGVLQGEILNSFVLNSIFSYSVIGSFEFLAVLFLTSAGLGTWVVFENITVYLDSIIQKRVRERQG
ncbi:hypothetical protein M3936_07340 [Sutcliffiella horikoshii]|uniref:YphA family membrane protein n=1 Tax=Sutcliffiella horikoshii TaxID=79883 RepID=UPI00203EEF7A|nr:hypothetical protein [Sutcliffiella horikoshii]MCM3617387.1 hypothetical protein [Sutcliffiella horikoshii]